MVFLFDTCFAGEKMSTHDDGRAPTAGPDMCRRPLKDWKAINKSRPEDRKKVDQKTRKFLPLTDAVIENHLLGQGYDWHLPSAAGRNLLVSCGGLRQEDVGV